MTVAILGLISTIAGFVIWLWKRKAAKSDDPILQNLSDKRKADEIIAKGKDGIDDLNAFVDDHLRELQAKANRPAS
jgi:hypothetical protein